MHDVDYLPSGADTARYFSRRLAIASRVEATIRSRFLGARLRIRWQR